MAIDHGASGEMGPSHSTPGTHGLGARDLTMSRLDGQTDVAPELVELEFLGSKAGFGLSVT